MATTPSRALPYKIPKRRHWALAFVIAQPLGAAGLVVILVMGFAGIFAELVAPYDPLAIDFGAMLAAPSVEHPMGTDAFGRDIISRVIYGSRTALTIGFLSSFFGCTIGAAIGIASAFFGGRTDMIVQAFIDILLSFPIIVLALVVVAMIGRAPLFERRTPSGQQLQKRCGSARSGPADQKRFHLLIVPCRSR